MDMLLLLIPLGTFLAMLIALGFSVKLGQTDGQTETNRRTDAQNPQRGLSERLYTHRGIIIFNKKQVVAREDRPYADI